jgi:hypothetical protein
LQKLRRYFLLSKGNDFFAQNITHFLKIILPLAINAPDGSENYHWEYLSCESKQTEKRSNIQPGVGKPRVVFASVKKPSRKPSPESLIFIAFWKAKRGCQKTLLFIASA